LGSEFANNAAFHNDLAAKYDSHLAIGEYNLLAREAFVALVTRHVAPRSTLLDFGCGTGIDACQYAQNGYRVQAYDNSPGMIAQLEQRCKTEIASRDIVAWSEGYPSFLARFPQLPAPSAAVADFAVLNSIPNLETLFDTLRRHLSPPGWVIVSLLNPLHWQKLKTPRWWIKGLWEGNRSPVFTTQPYVTSLHFVPGLLRAAQGFHLVGRANSGRFVRYDAILPGNESTLWWGQTDSRRKRLERVLWQTPARLFLGHFVFLVLRRDL
jgi:SAM-dependent methyltransferase